MNRIRDAAVFHVVARRSATTSDAIDFCAASSAATSTTSGGQFIADELMTKEN
jgi:hypothetical protein